MAPCFSPDTELIGDGKLTLFKLTTPPVPSCVPTLTGHFLLLSQFSVLHESRALTALWISCLCPCSLLLCLWESQCPSSPFSLPYQGPSPVDTFLLDPQLLRMGKTAEQMGSVLSSPTDPPELLTVPSVGFSLVPLKLCAVCVPGKLL